jgi:hypothetical protein
VDIRQRIEEARMINGADDKQEPEKEPELIVLLVHKFYGFWSGSQWVSDKKDAKKMSLEGAETWLNIFREMSSEEVPFHGNLIYDIVDSQKCQQIWERDVNWQPFSFKAEIVERIRRREKAESRAQELAAWLWSWPPSTSYGEEFDAPTRPKRRTRANE